jgi:hypothetical protein
MRSCAHIFEGLPGCPEGAPAAGRPWPGAEPLVQFNGAQEMLNGSRELATHCLMNANRRCFPRRPNPPSSRKDLATDLAPTGAAGHDNAPGS